MILRLVVIVLATVGIPAVEAWAPLLPTSPALRRCEETDGELVECRQASSDQDITRRFFLEATSTMAVLLSAPSVSNAYGEFEPGAKARKKAAKTSSGTSAAKTNESSPSTSSVDLSSSDLRGALGGFSYSTSSDSAKKGGRK